MQIGPLKLKAQLYCGDEIAMGPGKADLLEAIEREGSISRAGQAMGMSYRRTWLLVDAMNRCWSERLVETISGGASNRGARLTPCGQEVLRLYRAIEHQLESVASGEAFAELSALLRAAPLDPKHHSSTPQAD
ncbi:winged helix-turn-helix domain-containing protein [Sphingomonas colocasiae]|uniref:LysR family transcriptional regulator n=1 Tax=Sphingomonas colocasiae TaxID=1848973 RepID=A0ABS7PK68_9SPHN|nr:LysR family transcriptional regulator [Sphingomonas colocasiae]MBY8821641.1 LysR family transcriptional regulator [Sphingomonas colocasiae]